MELKLDLLYFILASYGLTSILVYGKIFNPVRPSKKKFNGFFHCPQCVGFHVGWFLFLINGQTELFNFDYSMVNFFILGWLSSGTSYLLSMLVADYGFRMEVKKDE